MQRGAFILLDKLTEFKDQEKELDEFTKPPSRCYMEFASMVLNW